jgi:hypothetical protein
VFRDLESVDCKCALSCAMRLRKTRPRVQNPSARAPVEPFRRQLPCWRALARMLGSNEHAVHGTGCPLSRLESTY